MMEIDIIFYRNSKIYNFFMCKRSDFKHILVVSCAMPEYWPNIGILDLKWIKTPVDIHIF